MNEFDAELIYGMTRNICQCPDCKCSACVHSTQVIDKQVQQGLARYTKLEQKLELLTKCDCDEMYQDPQMRQYYICNGCKNKKLLKELK